jgi:radical SAM protein with 4Fe4S-binding SPASM domain
VLHVDDPKVKEFFNVVDTCEVDFSIGFDSCCIPGLINHTNNINPDSYDTCEGGRWSAYITSDMKMLPCSFDNQELRWAYDISSDTVQNAWNSEQFENFRNHFRNSCSGCSKRYECMGGCPIRREVVLCNRKERDLL